MIAKVNKAVLFLFLLLLPTQLGKHFFVNFSYIAGVRIDYLSPTLFITDILAFVLICLNLKTIISFFKQKQVLLISLLLLINIFFALNREAAIYSGLKIIELICLFAIYRKNTLSAKWILIALTTGAIFETVLATLQFVNKGALQGLFYWFGERAMTLSTPDIAKASIQGIQFLRPYGTFSHPNSLAGFYVLVYFFALTYKPFKQMKMWVNPLILFSAILVFFSFSKTAILTFLVLNVVHLILQDFYKHCKFCFVSRIISFTVLSGLFFLAKGDILSGEKRLELAQNALMVIVQHPLTGTGIGNYLYAQAQFPIKYSYLFLQPVHNIFLLFFAEWGLVLGGIILYLAWPFIRRLFRKDLILATCAVLLTGLLDHYWITLQQNWLLLPVVFGLLTAYNTRSLSK